MAVLRVGLLGTGNISPAYCDGIRDWDVLELAGAADIIDGKAARVATEHGIPQVMSVDELLSSPDIDIIVNLTPPLVHATMSLRALEAGKHVYTEKPVSTRRSDAQRILEAAAARGLRVGSAPDTFLFGQHQTVRQLIDEGAIGEPVAAVAHMAGHGPEAWHPNPAFFYQPGGGPLLDMGPYYITCLVNLLGPVKQVMAVTRRSFDERTAGEAAGFERLAVTVPTHYAGVLQFESGAVASTLLSFDIWNNTLPQMEIYGAEGSLRVPDPNGWEPRSIYLSRRDGEWEEVPSRYAGTQRRGIGLADMAQAILSGRSHRASGELAYHALDVMESYFDSSEQAAQVNVHSTVARPDMLPGGLPPRQMDA